MAKIKQAPSPAAFAKEWTKNFAAAVRQAAGKDGRLSASEAKKIAKQSGAGALFADNAANFLKAKGQKSVDVEKLIAAGHDYAKALGHKIAGRDGRISFQDAKKLPADLQADYAYLRGKSLDELQPTGGDRKKLMAAAAKHVIESSGGGWDIAPGKLYPGVKDGGYDGTTSYFFEGATASRIADFLNAHPTKPNSFPDHVDFDPKKHVMISVNTSWDEEESYFSRMDRKTGQVTFLGKIEMVDVSWAFEDKPDEFAKLFPGLDLESVGGGDVQESLMKGGEILATGGD